MAVAVAVAVAPATLVTLVTLELATGPDVRVALVESVRSWRCILAVSKLWAGKPDSSFSRMEAPYTVTAFCKMPIEQQIRCRGMPGLPATGCWYHLWHRTVQSQNKSSVRALWSTEYWDIMHHQTAEEAEVKRPSSILPVPPAPAKHLASRDAACVQSS